MYFLRRHRQTVLLELGVYGPFRGDDNTPVGLQQFNLRLFLLQLETLLSYVVVSFQRHKAHDEEAFALG